MEKTECAYGLMQIVYKHPGGDLPAVFSNVQRGAVTFLLRDLRETLASETPIVFICESNDQLDQIERELRYLLPESPIFLFPEWNTIPYDRISPEKSVMAKRVHTLSSLKAWRQQKSPISSSVILTTARAVGQKIVSPQEFHHQRMILRPGMQIPYEDLLTHCYRYGLDRVDVVREAGSYAVRGGLIDVFPSDAAEPYRIDFFGEEIETLKTFDPASQRSLELCREVILGAGNELVLTAENRTSFKIRYIQEFGVQAGSDELVHSVLNGEYPGGIEQWLPFFHEKLSHFFEWLPANSEIISMGNLESHVQDNFHHVYDYYMRRLSDMKEAEKEKKREGIYRPVPIKEFYLEAGDLAKVFSERCYIKLVAHDDPSGVSLETKPIVLKEKKPLESFLEHLKDYSEKTIVTAGTEKSLGQLHGMLLKRGEVTSVHKKSFYTAYKAQKQASTLYGCVSPFSYGFQAKNFQFVTYQDLYGIGIGGYQRAKTQTRNFSLQDLNAYEVGDYLVHREHGVGRFLGLKAFSLNDAEHECVLLEYDAGNKLYIPVENLDILTKYAGKEGEVILDRLGTAHWQRRAAKVKEKLFDIAESLMNLAAKRQLERREAFDVTSPLYQEFCSQFPYVETPDQERAIRDVEADLADDRPMDRLVCGDVGFGKTEVAMRAAFLAATSGYQVLILTPTTVLCQQHAQNFVKRFEEFPVKIESLSRFSKPKEKKETIERLKSGEVQILISTHGVFSKQVSFKNLGLVVIDEEQHFGVVQKEYL